MIFLGLDIFYVCLFRYLIFICFISNNFLITLIFLEPSSLVIFEDNLLSKISDMFESKIAPLKKTLGNSLALYSDPWEQIHSQVSAVVLAESSKHLKAVKSFYGIYSNKYCMVVGEERFRDVICAHIWPNYTLGKNLEIANLNPTDVNNPRNFLRLHRDIERAFDKKQLCFVIHSPSSTKSKIKLEVCVLCPDLLSKEIVVNNVKRTFSWLNGRCAKYVFTNTKKPFLRLLSLHAKNAFEKASLLGWNNTNSNFSALKERCLELARLSLNTIDFNAMFPDV